MKKPQDLVEIWARFSFEFMMKPIFNFNFLIYRMRVMPDLDVTTSNVCENQMKYILKIFYGLQIMTLAFP